MLQILNVSHPTTGSLLLTKFIEFLDQSMNSLSESAVADVMEFLCIVENDYLINDERMLLEVSEELLWWRVLEHLLDGISDQSTLSLTTVSRLVICMLNILAIVVGSQDIQLIDRACLDESHHLSVYEQQAERVPVESEDTVCKVASKLLEYDLIDMPLVCARRQKSTSFAVQTVSKIVEKLKLVCRGIDSQKFSDILVRGKCQELVGVTWLHPSVMWSLRQRIFIHSYHELSSASQIAGVNSEIVSLCAELKPVADDIDRSTAELTELQRNVQHQFERTLFIIGHRLDGYEG